MKAIRVLALALATVALVASCQQATSSNNTTTTTTSKKLMIDLPKSLTGSTAAAGLSVASRAATSSGAYFMIHSSIGMTKSLVLFLGLYGTMIDAVVAQNGLTPSADTVTGKSITVTQAMLDQIKASIDTDMIDASGLPAVGATQTMPDFVYNKSANANFTYSFAMPSASMTFYWNTDKSKVGMSSDMGGMTMTIANDTTTNSMAMKISSTGASAFTYSMKFKSDADAATNHGVFVGMDVSGTGSGSITGYADDLGGAASYTMPGGSGDTKYVEEFGATGDVTYQSQTVGTGTPTVTGTSSGTYSAKTSATQTWGSDATTLFS